MTPAKIRAARLKSVLTQKEAAALIGKGERTWQNWETPEGMANHRKMDAALFDYWMIKANRFYGPQKPDPIEDDVIASREDIDNAWTGWE